MEKVVNDQNGFQGEGKWLLVKYDLQEESDDLCYMG